VRKPYIFGHRGSPLDSPENTLASFERALQVGADGVEVDVHRTRDGSLVVIHDPTLERTTNGAGRVEDKTLAELKELDAGSWFGEQHRAQKIPTFREVLELMHGRGLVMAELKVPGIARQLAQEIDKYGMYDHTIVSGAREYLREVRLECPHLPTLLAAGWDDSLERAQCEVEERVRWGVTHGIRILSVSIYTLTDGILEACRRQGVTVWGTRAWDPSDLEIQSFLALGLDGLLTNVPGRVASTCRS